MSTLEMALTAIAGWVLLAVVVGFALGRMLGELNRHQRQEENHS